MSEKIENLMNTALDKMKEVVNADTVIGKAITTPDGSMVIPVSRVSYGFASGGSDFSTKDSKDMFGGGNGAGVNIIPVAFLVISPSGDVKLLQVESFSSTLDRIIAMTPDIVDKISKAIKSKKHEKAGKEEK